MKFSNRFFGAASRRDVLKLASFGILGGSVSGWLDLVAGRAFAMEQARVARARACIVLFMNGGPAQTFTFDMKPKVGPNHCPFDPIATSVPGIQVCEHLPRLARQMHLFGQIRGMSTAIADHGPARYLMRTGFRPASGLIHPSMGARVVNELVREDTGLPSYVTLYAPGSGLEGVGSGFLPPASRPLILRDVTAGLADLNPHPWMTGGMNGVREANELLEQMDRAFADDHQAEIARIRRQGYRRAVELMDMDRARTAFQIEREPDRVQDLYGRTPFGRQCLGARRLLEHGVKYIEILPPLNWDTHTQTVPNVTQNCQVLDGPMARLMEDLHDRGHLDDTLVVWMGDFGRDYAGSNHHARAWTTLLAGAGVRGGHVVGRTDARGMTVEDRPVSARDFAATIYTALGVDPNRETMVRNRPIRTVDGVSRPVVELFS